MFDGPVAIHSLDLEVRNQASWRSTSAPACPRPALAVGAPSTLAMSLRSVPVRAGDQICGPDGLVGSSSSTSLSERIAPSTGSRLATPRSVHASLGVCGTSRSAELPSRHVVPAASVD